MEIPPGKGEIRAKRRATLGQVTPRPHNFQHSGPWTASDALASCQGHSQPFPAHNLPVSRQTPSFQEASRCTSIPRFGLNRGRHA